MLHYTVMHLDAIRAKRRISLSTLCVVALLEARCRWGTHAEHKLCAPAIKGFVAWPRDACRAIAMCANEVTLDRAQRATLAQHARRFSCPAP